MADFDINRAEVHIEDNNKYYKIPAGTTIYRGSDERNSHRVDSNPPPFFGFLPNSVDEYGAFRHTYSIKSGLKLLAIMEMDKKSKFYREAPQNIKTILETNFGYNTKNLRYSPIEYGNHDDRSVMEYLCNKYKSYDGYAMDGRKKKAAYKDDKEGNGNFHAELVVCGDSLHKVVDEVPSTIDGSPGKPRMGVSTEKAFGGPIKKRPRIIDSSPNENNLVGNLGFGDDSDSDSDNKGIEVSRTLKFGGNSRIRFKKRGKQTKRKGKRTKKIAIKYKKTRAKRKQRGGGKKTVSFKSCKSDADCWLSEPECDTKNNICVQKKVFHK